MSEAERDLEWRSMDGRIQKIRDMSISHIWNCINHTNRRGSMMRSVFINEVCIRHFEILFTLRKLELLADSIPPTRYRDDG